MAKLKIPTDVVEIMRRAIEPLDTNEVRDAYRSGNYPRAEHTKDVDKRYRWDLLHASSIQAWDLYDIPGVNDSHIDSALRSIVRPLGDA